MGGRTIEHEAIINVKVIELVYLKLRFIFFAAGRVFDLGKFGINGRSGMAYILYL